MKTWFLAVMFAAAPASAGNIWITMHDGSREFVAELGPKGPVTALAHASTMAFGESATQIAVVSYDQAAAQNQLRVLDKQTRALVATWPVPTTPVSLLSGAAPDIVLLDDTAYLLTHATNFSPGFQYTRNERGGGFNVVRIALRTGETRVLPLTDAFFNPRLCNYDGVPVVTDWAGYSVWRLAPDGKDMVSIIGRDEILAVLPAERAQRKHRTLPFSARADFVAVPGAGVFRLSMFGQLHRVIGPDLVALPAPFAALELGPAQDKELLLAVASKKGPAIAVVRRKQDKRTVAFVDAATLTVSWEQDLPQGARPWSMIAADPDAVFYVDSARHAVMRTDRSGTKVIRELPVNPRLDSAHLLSAGKP
jgi:hypothetical protein